MPSDSEPAGFLIMAAGEAQRFGARKQLAQLQDSRTLLETTYARIRAISSDLRIIVSPHHNDVIALCQSAQLAHWILPYPTQTLAQSIGLAVAAHRHWPGWIIALADMPAIRSDTYQRIQQTVANHLIVVPKDPDGRQGHPIGFGVDYYSQLTDLINVSPTTDQGARQILAQHPDKIQRICCDDPGIVLDIDRPSDIKQHYPS